MVEPDQTIREEIAKLLRFETSALPAGQTTSFDEYASRMRAGARNIYFLSAPNRELAEASPYFEAMKKKEKDTEVGLWGVWEGEFNRIRAHTSFFYNSDRSSFCTSPTMSWC